MTFTQSTPNEPVAIPSLSAKVGESRNTGDVTNQWLWVLAAIVVGIVVRAAFVSSPARLTGDEVDHYTGSVEVARGILPSVVPFRPPAYVYFGGVILRLFGDNSITIRIAQILLEGITIFLIVRLGRHQFGTRAGILAGWLYALSPEQISYSHLLWTESVLCLMVVAGWIALQRLYHQPGIFAPIATGTIWAILALLKPYNVYFFPILVTMIVVCKWRNDGHRSGLKKIVWGSIAVVVQFLWVYPWCDFTSRPATIISSQGQRVLEVGTNYFSPPQFDFAYRRDVSAIQRRTLGRRSGIVSFVLRNPGLFMSRTVEKMANLWAPNSFLIRHLYSGHYDDPYAMPIHVRIGLPAITILTIGVVLILAAFGIGGAKIDFFCISVVCYVALTVMMISLTVSLSRYRVPLMPLLTVYAASFIADSSCKMRLRKSEARTNVTYVAVFILLMLWAYRLPSVVLALW